MKLHITQRLRDIFSKTKITDITEKQRQYYRLIGLSVCLVCAFSLVMYYLNQGAAPSRTNPDNTVSHSSQKTLSLASALDSVTLDDRWLSKEAAKLQSHDQLLKRLQAKVAQLTQSHQRDQQHAQTLTQQLADIKHHHETQWHTLMKRLNHTTNTAASSNPMINALLQTHENSHSTGMAADAMDDNEHDIVTKTLSKQETANHTPHETLPYSPFENVIHRPVKKSSPIHPVTPDYLPAGTFAKAIMLGGLDAATDLSASNNPRPVLLKIIDQGHLPNHQQAHLKGCVITAAGMGDVSSERGYIRLERLSCVRSHTHHTKQSQGKHDQTRDIIDVPVFGTVFGPSGQDGVRGTAVYRAKQLVTNSFAAGLASGFGKALQDQSMTALSESPYGMAAQFTPAKTLEAGAANGVNTALDRLADYYIKRAERYHPIVQIHAGTLVDVVFLKGVLLQPYHPTHPSEMSGMDDANTGDQHDS